MMKKKYCSLLYLVITNKIKTKQINFIIDDIRVSDKVFLANTYIMAIPFTLLDLINTVIAHIVSIINIILSYVTVG